MENLINPKVITLCGSTKFIEVFHFAAFVITRRGDIVLLPALFINNDGSRYSFSRKELEILHNVHNKKIEMSNEILVMDIDGYIGESTTKEIEYAKSLGITVKYYSEELNAGKFDI